MYSNESISHVFICYCLPKVGSQHQLLHCYVSNRLQFLLICAFYITFPFAVTLLPPTISTAALQSINSC